MAATDLAPLVSKEKHVVLPVATAGNDLSTVLGVAPFDGVITAVEFVPLSTVTGAATNNRTMTLTNRAGDGSGTKAPATIAFGAGVTTAAYVKAALTLSGTASDLTVAEGDVLTWASTHVGTGIADPGGLVRVTYSRNL